MSGKVDPIWIAGLVDERLQRDWQFFAEKFDLLESAPEALRGKIEGRVLRARSLDRAYPGQRSEEAEAVLLRVNEGFAKQGAEASLKHLLEPPEDLSEPVCAWFKVLALIVEGRTAEVAEALDRTCELDPDFYEAHLVRVRLGHAGDLEEALNKLQGDFPTYLDTYEDIAKFHLGEGRLDDARAVYELGVRAGISLGALDPLGTTILRARYGPAWSRSYSYDSKNYSVASDISKATCVRIATDLEECYRRYNSKLMRVPGKSEERFKVYCFAGKASYDEYCDDLLGAEAENSQGLYSPWLKQLLLWSSPEPERRERTVQHEGFHQYFHRLAGSRPPIWLNEGLAEYFEQARFVDGRWKDDQLDEVHLTLMSAPKRWTHLERFVHLSDGAFRRRSALHYAESWALVHHLMNAGKDPKARLQDLLEGLVEGLSNDEAIARAFEGVEWSQFQLSVMRYIVELYLSLPR